MKLQTRQYNNALEWVGQFTIADPTGVIEKELNGFTLLKPLSFGNLCFRVSYLNRDCGLLHVTLSLTLLFALGGCIYETPDTS